MHNFWLRLSSWITKRWLWILIPALILIVASLLAPGPFYFWSARGFKSLLHDDLGIGEAWSSFLSLALAFIYALAVPASLRWLALGRRRLIARLRSLGCILILYGSTPILHAFLDSNFNQSTGEAQKWYIWRPDNAIMLFDSGGFDPTYGSQKRLLTPEVARILENQKHGLLPNRVLGDPSQLRFFDPGSGQPRIWFHKTPGGKYELFDAEGFFPGNGDLLLPVTNDVVDDIKKKALLDSNFNQASGESQKWYVWRPNDQLVFFDSGGFDSTYGVERRPLTPAVLKILENKKLGIEAHRITGDPRALSFFDTTSGLARIWYHKASDGRYELFDAEGFSPDSGEIFHPVTDTAVSEIKKQADADEAQAQAAAAAAAAQANAAKKSEHEKQAAELFGTESYSAGAVIVGVRARQPASDISSAAAEKILSEIVTHLENRGISAAPLHSGVYDSPSFDALMRGETAVLTDSGLVQKTRAVIVAEIEARCQEGVSTGGIVSCTVAMNMRILKSGSSTSSPNELSETGAGTGRDDAIARAAELLIERHYGMLDGV